MIRLLPYLLVMALMIWAFVDIIMIDGGRVNGLPKGGWITLVIFVPLVGAILWVLIGREPLRPRNHGRYRDEPLAATRSTPTRSAAPAPDDDLAFLERMQQEKRREERIRELERRLAEREGDGTAT